MAQPHDHLFQLAFGDPAHAVPLLRSGLPAEVAAALDWRTLTRLSATQRGRRGRRVVCDVLFSVRSRRGREVLIYVVLEHKSKGSRFDSLQMLEQVVGVMRTHRRLHPKAQFLPVVLPIVVHAGPRPFPGPTNLRELFDVANLSEEVLRYVPSFEFVLDDLSSSPPEHLRGRALSVLGLCVLSTLQYLPAAARDEAAFAAWLDQWRDVQERAAELADAGSARDLYDAVVDYIFETSDLPHPVVHRVMQAQLTGETMKKFVSTRTQIRNEGKAEGQVEGRVELLLRQIARRFGADAAGDAESRLQAATPAELETLADRVLDASSFDDLFGA
ncbi:MAG: Rpn family recombination-promoting nuclease/putative transposase [Planctomycetes bacterium]|nr:Rpn family recombination-promoting nuclease/putative transposase [Planctomycetota bacterium]